MDYCARYDGWKFCNFYRPIAVVQCDAGESLPNYVQRNLTQHYMSKLYGTQKRHGTMASSTILRGNSYNALYDMVNDPFELYNLNGKNHPMVDEIRAWAEAEIGRPEVPVVGADKHAYVEMTKRAGFVKVLSLFCFP